jgi:cytochrome P450
LFIDKIIGQSLSQSLDLIQPDMYDEIRHAVDSMMGTDVASWREIDLNEAMSTIIDRTCNRVLFGLSLCRNKTYLRILHSFVIFMGASTLLIGQLPPWFLRPVAGVLLSILTLTFKKLSMSYIRPLVKERMRSINDDKENQWLSHDFVTQSVKSVKKFKIPIAGDATTYITEQFLFLSFAAMLTLGAVATNIFLDILSASPQSNLYETLRLEAASIFKSEADWTSPASMKKMTDTDSTIRETMRLNPLQSRGLLRQVMPKDGIALPDGTHVPQGTWLGVPVQALQMDDKLYKNPHGYDPLRFARLKKIAEAESKDSPSAGKNLDAAQPSDKYMSFSYGRSSCPGRWFAIRLLKLMIAYITVHYDIKPLAHRPQSFSFGDANIPSFSTKITVRRRKQSQLQERVEDSESLYVACK